MNSPTRPTTQTPKIEVKVLVNGSIAFETGNDYLIVRQVRNRGEQSTNYSNNVGSFVVTASSLTRFYTESNDLSHLVAEFSNAVRAKRENNPEWTW